MKRKGRKRIPLFLPKIMGKYLKSFWFTEQQPVGSIPTPPTPGTLNTTGKNYYLETRGF